MAEQRQAPRYRGSLLVGLERTGRAPVAAQLLEVSRTGGLLATGELVGARERAAIHFSVGHEFIQAYGLPDILRFEVEFLDPNRGAPQGSWNGTTQAAFRFPADVLDQYWHWLDGLATGHGMTPITATAPPQLPAAQDASQPDAVAWQQQHWQQAHGALHATPEPAGTEAEHAQQQAMLLQQQQQIAEQQQLIAQQQAQLQQLAGSAPGMRHPTVQPADKAPPPTRKRRFGRRSKGAADPSPPPPPTGPPNPHLPPPPGA